MARHFPSIPGAIGWRIDNDLTLAESPHGYGFRMCCKRGEVREACCSILSA
jgi:hypothetical protein